TYTFLIEGEILYGTRAAYELTVYEIVEEEPVQLTLGSVQNADLDYPGQVRRFSLALDDAKRLVMDSLVNSRDLLWSLTGPDGAIVTARAMDQTDANRFTGNPVLSLEAGTYDLTIFGNGTLTGAFEFRMIDLDASATDIGFNDEIFGNLPSNGLGTRVFSFEATRHQPFSMNMIESPARDTSWRVIDADGNQAIPAHRLEDAGGFVLNEAGRYYLLLEGNVVNGETEDGYRFELVSPGYPSALGDTLEEFGTGSSIGHVLSTYQGTAPGETAGGGGTVLQLLDILSADNRTGIAFSTTAEGRFGG
ncbi:hypothetical protein AB9K41_17165, partial [Cribrihabitans sp. XS_ASV171]